MELLHTADGVRLAACRWPAPTNQGTTVVIAHGFTGTRLQPHLVAIAEQLAANGFDVLSYDARGHGDSEGVCTLGNLERLDVAAAADAAAVDADRVVLLGTSMGAIAVLAHAAQSNALTGIVTVSSPARWRLPRTARGMLAAAVTQTPPGRLLAQRLMKVRLAPRWSRTDEPVDLIGRVRAPVAIVHGRSDHFIPLTEAHLLYESAPEPRRLELVPDMGHAFDAVGLLPVCDAVAWAARAAAIPSVA